MDNKDNIIITDINYSCSYSQETRIPGHLFLVNDWEELNPTPNSGALSLWVPK